MKTIRTMINEASMFGQGILYANHISRAGWAIVPTSPPTHSLTKPATAVLTAHPARMTNVVYTGWVSNTTDAKMSVARHSKKVYGPRKPNPAAIPPRTFLTTHSLSNLSSSRISIAPNIKGFVKMWLALYWGGSGREGNGFVPARGIGRHIESRKSRKSFVRDE